MAHSPIQAKTELLQRSTLRKAEQEIRILMVQQEALVTSMSMNLQAIFMYITEQLGFQPMLVKPQRL